jgi:NAD dependent epimerase/dehydratase family enzyme
VLRLAFGEAADPIVESVRAEPKKLQQHGFEFRFRDVREALTDILH